MWSEREPGAQDCNEHRPISSISAKINAYGGMDSFLNVIACQQGGFPHQQQSGIQHSLVAETSSRQLDHLAPFHAHRTYYNRPGSPCPPCQTFPSSSYSSPYFTSVDTAVEKFPRDAASLENQYSEEGYLPQTYADQPWLTCLVTQPHYLEETTYYPIESPHVVPPAFNSFEMDAVMYLNQSNASFHRIDAPFAEAGPSSWRLEDMPIFHEQQERVAGFSLSTGSTTPTFTSPDPQVVNDDFNYPQAVESPSASSSSSDQPDRSSPDADDDFANDSFIIISMAPPPQTHASSTPSPPPSSTPSGHMSHCQWLACGAYVTKTPDHLGQHFVKHLPFAHSDRSKKSTWRCDWLHCGEQFKGRRYLKRHYFNHMDLRYKCKKCERTCSRKDGYKRHTGPEGPHDPDWVLLL